MRDFASSTSCRNPFLSFMTSSSSMAVSALYTGSVRSARDDGVEPLGENRRAASTEILIAWARGVETTTALEELERRYHVKPIAYSVLFLAANQQTNAAQQGRARRQKGERTRLRHPDARSGVSASGIDEEHRERHQSDQQPIVLLHEGLPSICDFWATGGTFRAPSAGCAPIHTYGAGGEARDRPCQARRHCLRADGRAQRGVSSARRASAQQISAKRRYPRATAADSPMPSLAPWMKPKKASTAPASA